MSAKIKQIKILSLVFVVLLATTIFLALSSPQKTAVKTTKNYEITKIALNEIGAIAVNNEKSAYGLFVDGVNVYMESLVEGNYSQAEMRTIVYALSNLNGTNEIKNPKNPEQYGFDSPKARITIIMLDKTLVKLALLNQNPIDGGYYLFSEDKQSIYTIDKEVGQILLREEKDFFEKTIFPIISTDNIDKISLLKVEYGKGLGRSYEITGVDAKFNINSPISSSVESLRVMSDLLLPISALYADNVYEDGNNLKELGFDDFSYKITMVFDNKEFVAAFSTFNNKLLMADMNSGTIFEIGSDAISFLKSDYLSLFNGKAYAFSLGDVSNILIEFDKTQLNMDIFGAGIEINAKYDNKKLEYQSLVEFYAVLNSIEIASQIDNNSAFVSDIKMTISKKQGNVDVVEIGKNVNGECVVRVNGEINFATTQNVSLQIKNAINAIK